MGLITFLSNNQHNLLFHFLVLYYPLFLYLTLFLVPLSSFPSIFSLNFPSPTLIDFNRRITYYRFEFLLLPIAQSSFTSP